MKLYSLLNEHQVLIEEPVATFEEALAKMLEPHTTVFSETQRAEVMRLLVERERQHPSIIDQGVCVAHTRLEKLDRFVFSIIVPETPIPHPDPSVDPLRLIFMIVSPQHKNTMMLQTVAAIARLLSSRETRQAMLNVRTPARMLRVIEESGVDIKKTLIAADVMAPVEHWVTVDTILAKAVDVLVEAPDEGIPVLSADGRKLVGELTSRELLILGMPKYMDLIVNPTMLESFEPFENFFKHENTMSVREVCRRDVLAVKLDAPMVEVVHLMMTRRKRRVYVVEETTLKGVIYRRSIIERVLHM